MKRTIREFGECPNCRGRKLIANHKSNGNVDFVDCRLCDDDGQIIIKETIEESDDMKEFIEKKCGWELCEGKEQECDKCGDSGIITKIIPGKYEWMQRGIECIPCSCSDFGWKVMSRDNEF